MLGRDALDFPMRSLPEGQTTLLLPPGTVGPIDRSAGHIVLFLEIAARGFGNQQGLFRQQLLESGKGREILLQWWMRLLTSVRLHGTW